LNKLVATKRKKNVPEIGDTESVGSEYEETSCVQPAKPEAKFTPVEIGLLQVTNLKQQAPLITFCISQPLLKTAPLRGLQERIQAPPIKEIQTTSIRQAETSKKVEIKVLPPELVCGQATRRESCIGTVHLKTRPLSLELLTRDEKDTSKSPTFVPKIEVRCIDIHPRLERIRLEFKRVSPQAEPISVTFIGGGERVASAIGQPEPSISPEKLEFGDFIRLILGIESDVLSQDRPLCIIVRKDEYEIHKAIAVLLRDLYRERVGGLPTPIWINNIRELKEYWNSLVKERIIVVERADIDEEDNKLQELFQILEMFFSQSLGALVLVMKNPEKLKQELCRLLSLSDQIIEVDQDRIINLKTYNPELLEQLLKLIRGKPSIEPDIRLKSIGEAIRTAIEQFDKELIKLYLNPIKALKHYPELAREWDKVWASSPELTKLASRIHSAIKALIWIYEWRKNDGRVEIELESDDWDLKIIQLQLVYEIETLYGAGDVLAKLSSKMRKFIDKLGYNWKIVFVLRNVDILRHLRLLHSFVEFWRKQGCEVEVKGIDLEKGELIDLDKFVQLMKAISQT